MKRFFETVAALAALFFLATAGVTGDHEHASNADNTEVEVGVVRFANSGLPDAQMPFLRGLVALHNFEYSMARRSFLLAEQLDPNFAMAVWGEALTYNHTLWNEQDAASARAALAKLGSAPADRIARGGTSRERLYLASVEKLYGPGDKSTRNLAYSDAMRDLSRQYPEDLDARALYALSLLGLSPVRNHVNYMRAAAEAETVYDVEKRHPGGLHYMIHAYDDPVHAPLGLRAARLYSQVAPNAPHARHMTSHIFFALGLWDEAIESNEASLRVARDLGDTNYHALLWLEYAYLQEGKQDAAAALVRSVAKDVKNRSTKDNRLRLALARAIWLVETRGAGGVDAEVPVDSSGIVSIGYFAVHDYARGITAARAGDLVTARTALHALRKRCDAAPTILPAENAAWYDAMTPNELAESRALATALQGMIEFRQGKRSVGLENVRLASAATSRFEFEFGPVWSAKPLDELLGEVLLEDGHPDEAIIAFQKTLAIYPNRRLALEGLAATRKNTSANNH